MKLSTRKQVIYGIITGVILIGIISLFTDDLSNSEEIAAAPASGKKHLVAQPVSEEPAKDAASPLFSSVPAFETAFNVAATDLDLHLRVEGVEVSAGAVNNTFNYSLSDAVSVIGTVGKQSGKVIDVTMIGKGDGTQESALDMLGCMGILMTAANPKLKDEERGNILKQLDFYSIGKKPEIDRKFDYKGFHYFLMVNDLLGVWFGMRVAPVK